MIITPASPVSPRYRLAFWALCVVLFFVFVSLIKSILLPFVVGMLAAYFLDPAVNKLRQWGWSRSLAAAAITISFFIVVVTLAVVLAPLLARQLSALIHVLPDYLQHLQRKYSAEMEHYIARLSPDQASNIQDAIGNFSSTLVSWIGEVATHAVRSGLALLNLLMLFFLTPVVAFYLLRDWDKFVERFYTLLPREHAAAIREQLHLIDQTLSGFIRGQTNVCLIMATYYGTLLSLLSLKFGLAIGIMTGFLLFIPFVGYSTGLVLSIVVGFFQFEDTAYTLSILAVYGVGQLLEGSILTPKLVGSKVGLHPLWIIFGMLSGAALFGFVGVLISVPVTAVLGVLARFAIGRYMQSSLYQSAPITLTGK